MNFGLDKLLFQYPKFIYLEGVVEFFLNLNEEKMETRLGLRETDEHDLTHLVRMDDLDFNTLFDNEICLYRYGADPEKTGDSDIQKELYWFFANFREI